jgi:hypothetical protein
LTPRPTWPILEPVANTGGSTIHTTTLPIDLRVGDILCQEDGSTSGWTIGGEPSEGQDGTISVPATPPSGSLGNILAFKAETPIHIIREEG